MDMVLLSGLTALCTVLLAMAYLIHAEVREQHGPLFGHATSYRRPWPRDGRHGYGARQQYAYAHCPYDTPTAPPRRVNPWAPFTVQPDTDLADLKRQYRALARHYHPDRGGDPHAMARINTLYAELKRQRA